MSSLLRVVPLFETLDDLERAPNSIRTLLSSEWYLSHINGLQECMIGESIAHGATAVGPGPTRQRWSSRGGGVAARGSARGGNECIPVGVSAARDRPERRRAV